MAEVSQHRLQKASGHAILCSTSKGNHMRKIEKQMNDAISNCKNWRLGNTEVTVDSDGMSNVYLYGKRIAEIGDDYIKLFDGGYRSATTKSRLNAILNVHGCNFDGVFQKKGEWFFHDSARSMDIPFESGMVVS
jgi:hypothetical protein